MFKWIVLFLAISSNSFAQDLDEVNLEDLLNVKTAVASKKETSTRATPGIVSIITDEEIRNMGARDLIDVLHLIPSIEFGTDVQGVVGLGIRGSWAHEGKFLLIIDGQEMNEILYSSTQFGNHYPVDQIKRIEVIRGPGSAIYGGYAELAVVNIMTKKGADLQGATAGYYYGRMKEVDGQSNVSASIGKTFGDWDLSFASFVGRGKRSDGNYIGADDVNDPADGIQAGEYGSFNYGGANDLNPHWFNLGISNKDLDVRVIYDHYQTTTKSEFGFTGLNEALPENFESWYVGAKYTYRLAKVNIEPKINYRRMWPWIQVGDAGRNFYQEYKIEGTRLQTGVTFSADLTETTNLLWGLEHYTDRAEAKTYRDNFTDYSFTTNNKRHVEYANNAAFVQFLTKTAFFDFIAGGRYEDPDFTDSSFVPRVGFTRAEDTWHAKLLYSQAFRTPAIFNIDANLNPAEKIKPEKTETVELELGHKVTSASYLTANIFKTKIKDALVYTTAGGEAYDNFGDTGSAGLELEYKLKAHWGQVQFGYAYYQADNDVAEYEIAGNDKAMLGMPQHKAVLNGFYHLSASKKLKLNPNIVYVGEKYARQFHTGPATYEQTKLPANVLANLFVSYEDAFIKGLGLGAGVYNLFNNDYRFVQPYAAEHDPVPGPTRELVVRADYHFGF